MSKGYHCDWRDCESWTYHRKRHGFITIKSGSLSGGRLHFCSWDCVLKFSAQFEPTEPISMESMDTVDGDDT